MKNWLLYFFAILLAFALLPIAASKTAVAKKTPVVTLSVDGELTEMGVEEYTLRVLLAEGEGLPPETKKALAVSVRSVAVHASSYGLKHEGFSFCTDKNCCFPLAEPEGLSQTFVDECQTAVDETHAAVLTDGNETALALFTRCAGSGTRSNDDIPYLTAVSESESCEIHKTERLIPLSVLGYGAEENSCIVYGENKKCALGILGGRATETDELVSLLGLKSPELVLTFEGEFVRAVSFGVGHCYGLNLCGAERMESKGYKYSEILKFYFPKLEMKKIYL